MTGVAYLDTSALVKLYVEEAGSRIVHKRVDAARIVATSRLAYVEARAGLARKHRDREVSADAHAHTRTALEDDWPRYFVVGVTEDVASLAGDLADRYGLRAYDAVHLASAMTLTDRTRLDVAFVCFDARLNEAAEREGLIVTGGNDA